VQLHQPLAARGAQYQRVVYAGEQAGGGVDLVKRVFRRRLAQMGYDDDPDLPFTRDAQELATGGVVLCIAVATPPEGVRTW